MKTTQIVAIFAVVIICIAGIVVAVHYSNDNKNDSNTDDSNNNVPISVAGVSLSETLGLVVGGSSTLTAVISPTNATNKNVTWSSSNTSVATVSSKGVVTAVSEGTATITVETSDGGYTADCTVNVTKDSTPITSVPVTGVSLNRVTLVVPLGGSSTLSAIFTPSTATNKNVTWSSSNTSVATVNGSGVVTAVSLGTTKITVKTDDGGYTADCTATVKIVIVDGSGATITLDKPLESVVTANTNVPKAMKVLGLTDEVAGLSFNTAGSSDANNWDTFHPWFPNAAHMSIIKSMTAEDIINKGCHYVICPVSSMTLSSDQLTLFPEMGITVIKLDCYGDTALEDLYKLTLLFGQKKTAMDAYNTYWSMCNGVIDTVKAKVASAASSAKDTFLYYMDSKTAFYNQTSEGSIMIEQIYGKNALRGLGFSTTTVTNVANDNLAEKIVQADAKNSIDKIFIRGLTTTSTATAALTLWNNSLLNTTPVYHNLSLISSGGGGIYVLNSNIMSGMLSYVGWVVIAEICGIDTGYDVASLIREYNTTYGFTEPTSGYAFQITIVGGIASATQVY